MPNRRRLLAAWTAAALLSPLAPALAADEVTELLRRQTQELIDAISTGTPAVWERYLDERAIVTGEDGRVMTKAELVAQIRSLPEGVSGSIAVTDFKAFVHGEVAVTTYVDDEHETYHGHRLHCQYRTTDTWAKTPDDWRLVASQILALRTDPPAAPLTARQIEEYVGRYSLDATITYEIRREGDGLVGQRSGREVETLRAEAPDVLFVPGQPRYRKIFRRGPDGRITGFVERREAWDLPWTRLPEASRASPGGQ
jgi:hypothetical protein